MNKNGILVLLLAAQVFPQTALRGDISENSFPVEGNPYIVEEDIFISEGKITEINAGCIFLFRPFTGLTVEGDFLINGTPDRPVIFSSINDSVYNDRNEQSAAPFDWNGILVSEKSTAVCLRNFRLAYSVYGLKSKNPNIQTENGIFIQNGQFNFTVDDKIIPVQDSVPFTLNYTKEIPESIDSIQQNAVIEILEEMPVRPSAFRFISLGIGVTGVITGVITGRQARLNYKDLVETSSSHEKWDDYYSAGRKYKITTACAVISGSFCLLGFTGFGVSFAF